MSRMSELAAEQEQIENLSGNDIFEAQAWEDFQNEMVCLYCGKSMVESYIPCCGEIHFDTRANIDYREFVAQHEKGESKCLKNVPECLPLLGSQSGRTSTHQKLRSPKKMANPKV